MDEHIQKSELRHGTKARTRASGGDVPFETLAQERGLL
jgi:hypothetical protein